MSAESQLQELIERVVKRALPLIITEGTVKSVDKGAGTCTVEREHLATLFKCRLNAVLDAGTDVVTAYPKEGSKVLCALVDNDPMDAFILSATKLEEVVWYGGTNGGMCIVPELQSQLGKLSARVDALYDMVSNGTTAAQDGGAALLAGFKTTLALVTQTEDFSGIENEKLKH